MGNCVFNRVLVPSFFLFLITILLSGCETGGEGSQFSANGSPDSPLNGQRHFSREVRVQFFSPELGRPTDYPYLSGTPTNRQVRAQENPLDRYVQVVRTSPGRFEAVHLQENDSSGHLVAYAPERDDNPNFGGVGDNIGWFPYPKDNPGSGTLRGSITRVWTPPTIDSDKPTLLQVGGVYVPVEGPSITVRVDWTIQWDEQLNGAVGVDGVVTVNGQEFTAENYEPSDRPGLLLGSPVFFSSQSGLHTVKETRVDVDGSVEELTWSYQQRALTLEEDLPELDMESAEPIEIRNKVVWDDGAPLDGSGVEWKVDIGGSEIPEQEKEGTGVDIYALWKPLENILERGGYVDPSTVPPSDQLVPVGAVISAQTPVYQDYRAIEDPQLGDIIYKIIRGFQVPGKVRIKIVNETVSPEEPFEGDSTSATVNAEVIFFDPEILEEDVEWKVYLQDADGNSVFEDPLATGEGCEISATWDGTINGAEPPKDPRTYQFALEADACGGDEPDVGVFRGVRSQEVDPGGSSGGTCTDLFAQNFVPVGFRFQISDLTFGGSPEAERNGNGPYLVYDYINDKAPNNQPQWVKNGDEIVPVVMKMGAPLYMKANFQLTQARSPFGLPSKTIRSVSAIRATLNFPGRAPISVSSSDIDTVSFEGSGLAGSVILPIPPLANTVGRHRGKIDWEIDLVKSQFEIVSAELSTPKQDAHMFYTVLGEQPISTKNSGGEKAEIWFHPSSFKESDPTRASIPRSPLDMATSWASGKATQLTAVEAISEGIYDSGWWSYTFQSGYTRLALNGEPRSFRFRSALEGTRLECPDGSSMLKILGNYVGAECSLKKFEHTPTTPNWSTDRDSRKLYSWYFKPMGMDQEFSRTLNPFAASSPIVAPFGKNTTEKHELSGADHSQVWIPLQIPNPTNGRQYQVEPLQRHPSKWIQVSWDYHQVTKIGDKLVDCVPRFSSSSQPLSCNPDRYLNQLNMTNILSFAQDFDKKIGKGTDYFGLYRREYLAGWRQGQPNNLLPDVILNSNRNAENALGLSEAPNRGLSEADYLNKLLYGYQSSAFVKETHFNEVRLPNQEFLKIEVLNL